MTRMKDSFSILPAEIEQARAMLGTMVKDLSDRFPDMFKKNGGSQTAPPQQSTTTQSSSAASAPLNAANLQQQQQQLNKLHQRSGSRGGSNTPAAPTSAQPPFQFGASSPHGQPAYIGKAGLTQENLHIPARKKQKPNSGAAHGQSTPGSTASPVVNKISSPELKRQQPVHLKPAIACLEPDCEHHNVGFENEEDLKRHTQEEHVKPLENPLKFAQENLAGMLGLNPDGTQKQGTAPELTAAPTGTKMAPTASKQGQTPNMKTSATPALASTPMNRQASLNDAKSNSTSQLKVEPSKDTPGKTQNDTGKKSDDASASDAANLDPWVNATIDPHELLQGFQNFDSGAGGAISDMNVYRSITPNDTPESSKDSGVSEPNSDISEGVALDISLDIFDENWQPFGPSDADTLFDMSSYNIDSEAGVDISMFDDDKPMAVFDNWAKADTSVFDKPFSFDTSFYSMNAE